MGQLAFGQIPLHEIRLQAVEPEEDQFADPGPAIALRAAQGAPGQAERQDEERGGACQERGQEAEQRADEREARARPDIGLRGTRQRERETRQQDSAAEHTIHLSRAGARPRLG